MTLSSFIYKPNPKKVKEDRMSLVYMFAFIALLLVIFIFFPVLKAGILLGTVSGGLIKIKLDEIKRKGVNRFGSLPFQFQLSADLIKVGETQFRVFELTHLEIEADDFSGGPGGDIFSSSLGTDNFISFTHRGEKHEYQFLIKTRSDVRLVQQIYAAITGVRV
jgi:hypothetical protein